MIELKGIGKSFASGKDGPRRDAACHALADASATFGNDEFVVLAGPSGSGKTTLLNCICGLDAIDEGQIWIDGEPTEGWTERDWDAFRAHEVGLVFRDDSLVDHLTALDNVMLALSFEHMPKARARELAVEALETVGVADCRSLYPDEMSGWQRQCTCIARAIAKDPSIVLADEPTGALDTQSGEMVIQALHAVGAGRTVIVATHNDRLAAACDGTRYEMVDGRLSLAHASGELASMDDPASADDPAGADAATARPAKSGMGIGYALSLAFSNLKKHRLRSALTILAASIGVLVIALIMAFSTGLTTYVSNVEQTSLSTAPVYISKYKLSSGESTSADVTAASTEAKESKRAEYLEDAVKNRRVALNNTLATLLSSDGNQNTGGAFLLNDVAALKKYLDGNPGNVQDAAASIEYTYDAVIYSTANDDIEEVYPGGLFGSLGSGSSGSKSGVTSNASFRSILNDFRPLPENSSVYQDDESLVEGHWPENSGECVLVLNSDGTMDDTLAYTLGFKNFAAEIEPLIEKYQNGEKVEYPGIYDSYSYTDVVGITFKVINPSEAFEKTSDGLWTDKSYDDDYMRGVVQNGRDLKVVGVVKPAEGSKANAVLACGIYYHPSLNTETIEAAKNSQVVQDQMASPDTDVLTGKSFAWLKKASTITERFDFSNIVNIDADMLASCVTLHPEVLDFSDEDFDDEKDEIVDEVSISDEEMAQILVELLSAPEFQEFLEDLAANPSFDADAESVLAQSGAAYLEYYAGELAEGRVPQDADEFFGETGEGYEWTLLAQTVLPESLGDDIGAFVAKYATKVANFIVETVESEIGNLVTDIQDELIAELEALDASFFDEDAEDDGPGLIEFDEELFANAIQINITEEDVSELGHFIVGNTSHTYTSNLADFGYADLDAPITCTIYPKSLSDKQTITNVLEQYNDQCRADDDEGRVVFYMDTTGTLVSIVLSAISAIGTLLLVFVSTSVLAVLVLIAIICGISTLQRKREIGILRALGASRRDVAMVFDLSTTLTGFLAGVVGCVVAGIVCAVANSAAAGAGFEYDIALLTPQIVVGVIAAYAVASALAGLIPSIVASRKDPAKCMRQGL